MGDLVGEAWSQPGSRRMLTPCEGSSHESSVAREGRGRERLGVGRRCLFVPLHDDQSDNTIVENVLQPFHPDTGAPLHDVRVMTAREETNLHPVYQLMSPDILTLSGLFLLQCSSRLR